MTLAHTICIATLAFFIAQPVRAQGTIQFGFEEFQIKDHPPFVIGPAAASVENSISSQPYNQVPAFEGDKFLVAGTGALIQSPNGEPIKSFSMHLFLIDVKNPWAVSVGGQALPAPVVGQWQTFEGTFASPMQSLRINAFWGIETIPGSVAIDAVQF